LIGSLATYAKVNKYGFIETPLPARLQPPLCGHRRRSAGGPHAAAAAAGPDSKEVLPAGAKLDADATARLRSAGVPSVDIVPWASPEVHYLSADEEDLYSVAQANAALHEDGTFQEVGCLPGPAGSSR